MSLDLVHLAHCPAQYHARPVQPLATILFLNHDSINLSSSRYPRRPALASSPIHKGNDVLSFRNNFPLYGLLGGIVKETVYIRR